MTRRAPTPSEPLGGYLFWLPGLLPVLTHRAADLSECHGFFNWAASKPYWQRTWQFGRVRQCYFVRNPLLDLLVAYETLKAGVQLKAGPLAAYEQLKNGRRDAGDTLVLLMSPV
jgi:hypothetical protein